MKKMIKEMETIIRPNKKRGCSRSYQLQEIRRSYFWNAVNKGL
ncbi:hypothetical protein [Enterococcus faecium]|nr:hypothetical protein [Enterococcus faecium]